MVAHQVGSLLRSGAYRVIYVATFENAVYVLHAFQKKTQATSKRDLDLATTRFKELMRSEVRCLANSLTVYGMRLKILLPKLQT